MTVSRRCACHQVRDATCLLIILLLTIVSSPLRAQLTTLTARGSTTLSNKDMTQESLLYLLDVHYISTNTDNGVVIKKVVQTNISGEYAMTVLPGSLDIHVQRLVNAESTGKYQVWLEGSLEGFKVNPDGIKVSPNSTIALPTITVEKRSLPVASYRRVDPWLSVPTLQLTRFTIPRGELTDSDGQIASDQRRDQGDRINVSVVDPNGHRITGAHAHAISSKTGEETEPAVIRSEQGFDFVAPADGVIFIHIDAAGFHSRTLLLNRRHGSAELYDEESVSLRRPVRIELQPIRPEVDAGPKSRAFSLDSSRGISFDTQVITSLPLPLFRNPDVLLELSPGFAEPPQTLFTVGPSLSPGIGTAGSFAINGIRARDNNFTVDGSDYNDEEFGVRRQGFITPFPQPIDSIEYYQAVTANGDARYGRSLGGDINVLSKAGGPKRHLSAYAFGRGRVLDVKEYFETDIQQYPAQYRQLIPITTDGSLAGEQVRFILNPGYEGLITVRNNLGFQTNPLQEPIKTSRISWGAAGGGPLGFGRVYWYASFERELQNGNTEQSFSVPTVRQRGILDNGDTGGTATNTGIPCFPSPLDPCSGSLIYYPATLAGDGILSLFPFPNNPLGPYGTNTYTAVLPDNAHGYVGSGRIDKETELFDHASTFTLRVNDTEDNTDLPSVGGAIFSSLKAETRTINFATYLTTTLSPRLFNTFRSSYGNSSAGFIPLGSPLLPSDTTISFNKTGTETGFLLNAPLLINVTRPVGGAPAVPVYISPSVINLVGVTGLSTTENTESVTGPIGQVSIVGYSPVGVDTYHFPQTRSDYTVQIADTISITSGPSISYVGIDTRSVNLNSYEDRNARPYAEFHGSPAFPSSVGLAAAGLPTGFYQTIGVKPESSITFGQRQLEIFGHEYFHAGPNLTISGGLRLELGVLPNANGRLESAFDPAVFRQQVAEASSQCAVVFRSYSIQQQQACQAVAQGVGAAFNGNFEQVFGSGFQGITPRLGLAWDASGDGRVVVRAGWGMYKSAFPSAVVDETRSAFDEFLPVNSTEPGDFYSLPSPTTPLGFNSPFCNLNCYGGGVSLQPGTLNLLQSGTNPVEALAVSALALRPVLITKLRQPYSFQFNSTVEVGIGRSSILEMAYVGSLGRRLIVASTPGGGFGMRLPNFSLLGADSSGFPIYNVFTGYTPDYTSSSVPPVVAEQFQSSASSSYNALQVSFQRRLSSGIQGGLSFTYSHTLDYSSDFFDTAGEYALPGNSQSPMEWGNSAYDVRLRTSGWFSWQLPSILHDKLTADWHVSGIVAQQGGQPFTVNTSVDLNQDGNATDRPLSVSGLKSTGRRRVQLRIIEPISEWAYPSNGLPAESPVGRNTFRSSGYSEVDTGVYRELDLPKVGRLTMRCDLFNLFNHPAFGIPVRILEAPSFGSSVNTVVPARNIQFGLKFSF
jgi:hypothetical protein